MSVKDIGPRIGADPEIFIKSRETNEIIPVCGLVGGTKDAPININEKVKALFGPDLDYRRRNPADFRGFYGVQEDNVMLEFNIPAFKEIDLFTKAIDKALATIFTTYLSPNYEMAWYPVDNTFKEEELNKHPQALEIGCKPDFYAYAADDQFEREPFTAATFGNKRFCGGHLHIQYDHGNVPKHVFAQFMDCVAALPYLKWDKQGGRRLYYGQPGLYRPKEYGIEYRTLSNFWLRPDFRDKQYLLDLVDNVMQLALKANTDPEFLLDAYRKISWGEVQRAIRTENHKLANELVDHIRAKAGLHINLVSAR